jgi:predicted aspartyl protease
MGKVVVEATVENLFDLYGVRQGFRGSSEVRRITVPDAFIDPEATRLLLPERVIQKLGLNPLAKERARARLAEETAVYSPVRLTVQGRDCDIEVMRSEDRETTIIGQTALLLMDWVVDQHGRLIGNPAHGGEHMIEV